MHDDDYVEYIECVKTRFFHIEYMHICHPSIFVSVHVLAYKEAKIMTMTMMTMGNGDKKYANATFTHGYMVERACIARKVINHIYYQDVFTWRFIAIYIHGQESD